MLRIDDKVLLVEQYYKILSEVLNMGIIKAVAGAVGGGLADSWLEVIEPDQMTDTTVAVAGVQVSNKRSSNKKGTSGIISNGSIIHVYPNQMMLLMDGGKIVDYSAEEGYYQVYLSSAPSMFNGELKDSVKETFSRIKFGGQPSGSQQVIYINLAEIKGIKFGTRNALQYFDNMYNAELFLRCHGMYSIKITDPLKFYMEAIPKKIGRVDIADINEQYLSEFMTALQSAISQMSVDGVRISSLPSKSMELSKYMSTVLDADWKEQRGFEVQSVGISSISYDDESKELINMRNKGAMLSDPSVREGYVQGSIARGMEAAGSNSAGAAQAFMGMGVGMQSSGNFMGSASQTNMTQMQMNQQAQAQAKAETSGWSCSCGQKGNTGNFCAQCGAKKPAEPGSWICSCGTESTGKFCPNCGAKKPDDGKWVCSCGAECTGKFCPECGSKKPE
jgi:membrane protease subunit (stomatin/prohibitin family)